MRKQVAVVSVRFSLNRKINPSPFTSGARPRNFHAQTSGRRFCSVLFESENKSVPFLRPKINPSPFCFPFLLLTGQRRFAGTVPAQDDVTLIGIEFSRRDPAGLAT